ncbi:O-antigen ligase family protein [Salinibacter altiplanensis]|uniref:O-antigen ligase family protein n=1 Tax=Salinibacter altiplanensis TaxID=1803181 RepID=UPI000C9F7FAF|nr:O-antigen ligase family protein [Salinibacter altiplanensis]
MRYWHLLFGTVFIYLAAQIDVGVPASLTGIGRWIVLFGVAGAGTWLLAFSGQTVSFPARTGGITTAILALLMMYLATALAGFAVRLSVLKWILLATQIYVFVFVANCALGREEWYALAEAFFLLLAGVMGVILLAALTGITLIATGWGTYVQGRLAVLANPNSIGMVALVSGVTALWAGRWPAFAGPWKRYVPWATAIGAVLVIMWTASRTSLAAFVVGAGIWVVATRKVGWSLGLGALLGFGVWVWSMDATLVELAGVMAERMQEDTLTASRDNVWEASLRNWREYPWFGHGYGVTDDFRMTGFASAVSSVRDGSGYFGVLESVGVVGVGMLIAFYGVVAWTLGKGVLYRAAAATRWTDWDLALYGISLFFSLAVHTAGEPWMLGPGSFGHLVFWMAVGIIVASVSPDRRHGRLSIRQEHRRTRTPGRFCETR